MYCWGAGHTGLIGDGVAHESLAGPEILDLVRKHHIQWKSKQEAAP